MKGEENQQDYGMRVYDPRIGKFLSVDPLTKEYPWNNTYAYAENDVIRCIDLDGLEKLSVTITKDRFGRTSRIVLEGIREKDVKVGVDMNVKYANRSDVTTRDVMIITKQRGVADQMSFEDMNQSYRDKIKRAGTVESTVDDNSFSPPDVAMSAIAQDIRYRNGWLKGKAAFDEAKYEYFSDLKNFKLPKPFEKDYTTPVYKNGIDPATGKKWVPGKTVQSSSISLNVELIQSTITKQIQAFNSLYPSATNQIVDVELSTGAASMGTLRQIGNGVNMSNVNISYSIDDNIKLPDRPDALPSSEDYYIKVKVSGVNPVSPTKN